MRGNTYSIRRGIMKRCTFCGKELRDDENFCSYCGAKQLDASVAHTYQNELNGNNGGQTQGNSYGAPNSGMGNQVNYNQGGYNSYRRANTIYTAGIAKRDLVTSIILSIVTCGLYAIYWVYNLNDELNFITGDTESPSGGTVILLSLVTCGIYSYYWMYKMGTKIDYIKESNENTAILYLILHFFQLGIVNLCLMQDTINRCVE